MDVELSERIVKQDYCRLCLFSSNKLHKLFLREPNESNAILMKISLLAEIILIPSEELDAAICSRCMRKLEDFDSFRRRCKYSDSQIRKFRQRNDPPPAQHESAGSVEVGNDSTESEEQEQASSKFGGIFDIMQYREDPVAPGEYRMLFDGHIYQKQSLLVWRCQLLSCPCQMLVERDFSFFRTYGTHHHGDIPANSDQREFTKMDQRVCAFLNKLLDQIDGTSEKTQAVAPCGSSSGAQQGLSMEEQQTVTPNPEATVILYSTEGAKPSIIVNFHRYCKEAVASDSPPLIYWRCVDKNCLGMIMTTVDLRSFKLHKDHNHVPKLVTERSPILVVESFPVKVAAVPMDQLLPTASTMVPERTSDTSRFKNVPQMAVAPRPIIPENDPKLNQNSQKRKREPVVPAKPNKQAEPNEASASPVVLSTIPAGIIFYKAYSKFYYMHYEQFFYRKDTSHSSVTSSEVFWNCVAIGCPGTMIVSINLIIVSGLAHNHGPIKSWHSPRLTVVSPDEALAKKPPIVKGISFFRVSTNERICLLYQRFIYVVHSFHPTGNITWMCRNVRCRGQLSSGLQFEYLNPITIHNHGPVLEQTVDVESYLPVQDALTQLKKKSKQWKGA